MKLTTALIATTAITALAAATLKTPQWEPIAPDVLARFARDTTHAHQLDSVAHAQVQAGQVIRQNALQNLGDFKTNWYLRGSSTTVGMALPFTGIVSWDGYTWYAG